MWTNPIFRGAVTGFVSAAWTDFRIWKSWDDVAFNYRIASYRWIQGAIAGALIGGGFAVV